MPKNFDVMSGTLYTTPDKAASEKSAQSVTSSSKPAKGLHGQGTIIASFNPARFLKPGETDLPVGTYDLEEAFPENAFVSAGVVLDVTKAKAGAGTLGVKIEGGTAATVTGAGKSALTSNEFALGTKVGGLKVQVTVTSDVITDGAFVIRIPYVISGV